MSDLTSAITNTISISMFNRGFAGKVFEDVKHTGAKVVMKNNTAECVLLSPEEYMKLMDEVNDARLLAVATERLSGFDLTKGVSEAEALNELGISEADLADTDNVEIE